MCVVVASLLVCTTTELGPLYKQLCDGGGEEKNRGHKTWSSIWYLFSAPVIKCSYCSRYKIPF